MIESLQRKRSEASKILAMLQERMEKDKILVSYWEGYIDALLFAEGNYLVDKAKRIREMVDGTGS